MIAIQKLKHLTNCCPERIEETNDWYCCAETHDPFCDLYEAQEITAMGKPYHGMTHHLLHWPDGTVYSPFPVRKNIYVEQPIWDNGRFAYLSVDFDLKKVLIFHYTPQDDFLETLAELPLELVQSCYNLKLRTAPLMLTRDENNGYFEILWPIQRSIPISDTESFLFRDGSELYFSRWHEDGENETYSYSEEVVIRDLDSGEISATFEGYLTRLPDGIYWRS